MMPYWQIGTVRRAQLLDEVGENSRVSEVTSYKEDEGNNGLENLLEHGQSPSGPKL